MKSMQWHFKLLPDIAWITTAFNSHQEPSVTLWVLGIASIGTFVRFSEVKVTDCPLGVCDKIRQICWSNLICYKWTLCKITFGLIRSRQPWFRQWHDAVKQWSRCMNPCRPRSVLPFSITRGWCVSRWHVVISEWCSVVAFLSCMLKFILRVWWSLICLMWLHHKQAKCIYDMYIGLNCALSSLQLNVCAENLPVWSEYRHIESEHRLWTCLKCVYNIYLLTLWTDNIMIFNCFNAEDGIFQLYWVNTMLADVLAPKVASTSEGTALTM